MKLFLIASLNSYILLFFHSVPAVYWQILDIADLVLYKTGCPFWIAVKSHPQYMLSCHFLVSWQILSVFPPGKMEFHLEQWNRIPQVHAVIHNPGEEPTITQGCHISVISLIHRDVLFRIWLLEKALLERATYLWNSIPLSGKQLAKVISPPAYFDS